MEALLRECIDEGVPRDDVSLPHLVEGELGLAEVLALGVHVDDAVAEENVGPRTDLGDVGMESSAALEVSELCAAEEEVEERFWRVEHFG